MNVNEYDCSAIYRSNRIGEGLSDANPKWTQKTGFEGLPDINFELQAYRQVGAFP